jgi:hypothetical protein
MTLAELRDRAEVRRVEPDDAHEVDALPAGAMIVFAIVVIYACTFAVATAWA